MATIPQAMMMMSGAMMMMCLHSKVFEARARMSQAWSACRKRGAAMQIQENS